MLNIGISITKNIEKYNSLINYMISNNKFLKGKITPVFLPTDNDIKNNIKNLDILLTYNINKNYFNDKSNNLKWIHLGNAGVDNSLFEEVIKSNVIITNSRGINSVPVSEFVLSAILFFSKNFSDCLKFKKNKKWTQWEIAKKNETLENKTLGIIGYGAIGKAIAKKVKAFNMNVIGIKRLQRKKEIKLYIDELLPINKLDYLLSNSDYIVISCPLTPLTKELINKEKLNLISKNSYLINISRGEIVDEKNLIIQLKNKLIKGAALDVFHNEPLNSKSELFNLKNVFLSPHISGNYKKYQNKVVDAFSNNLIKFINNKTLKNRICKKRLY